jgi:hypothetical protein
MINETTRQQIEAALASEDEDHSPKAVFEQAESSRAAAAAVALVTTFSAFASVEAGKQLAPGVATKTWVVSSTNPRSSHSAMNGQTVGIDEKFSNGMTWPGDPAGGVDEVAGCQCVIRVDIPD